MTKRLILGRGKNDQKSPDNLHHCRIHPAGPGAVSMSAYHWAQPDWQRITSPHTQVERKAEGGGTCRKSQGASPEKIKDLIEFLETGPKTRGEIRKKLGIKNDRVEMLMTLATHYEPRIWEQAIKVIGANKTVTKVFFGLADF